MKYFLATFIISGFLFSLYDNTVNTPNHKACVTHIEHSRNDMFSKDIQKLMYDNLSSEKQAQYDEGIAKAIRTCETGLDLMIGKTDKYGKTWELKDAVELWSKSYKSTAHATQLDYGEDENGYTLN